MNATVDLTRLSRLRALTSSGAARSVRLAGRLSLGEVASVVGCSPSTVFRWERGERRPRGEAALRYLEVLEELMSRD